MLEIMICVIGAVAAVVIAKQFLEDVQNEVAAHDDCSIEGDNDNNR